jgi:hypothetical protein
MKIAASIKPVLSSRAITLLIISVAVLSRIIQLLFFYNIHFDPSYQVIATENLLTGHGITITKAAVDNLSTPVYEPLIMWPPGYTLLLTPFYVLFGHNYMLAGITLDILFALILLFSCRAILKTLNTELWLINLFTLFTAFFIYFFYFMASSDAIAISLFAAALLYSLKIIKTKHAPLQQVILIAVCLGLCALLKYLYIPVALVIPAYLVFTGIINKEKAIQKAGYIGFSFVLFIAAVTLIYQKSISGSATYISATGRGFYPEHLLESYPFIPASFFNPASATSLTGNAATESFLLTAFKIVHLLFLLVITFFFIRHWRQKGLRNLTMGSNFFYIAFVLSVSITLLLAVLSVRVEKEQILPGYLWTYVQEPRYYGLITVLLHLSLFVLYQYYTDTQKSPLKYLLLFFFLLLLPEFFRGLIFTGKRVLHFNTEEYSWQWENRFQHYADSIIQERNTTAPVSNVVVAGPTYYLNNRVSIWSNAAALHDATQLNRLSSLKTMDSVLLLAIIDSTQFQQFQPFLADSTKELAGQFDRFYFYTVYVRPR